MIAFFPLLVSADEWYGLDEAAGSAGLITRKPSDVVTNIINALLGLLSTLFVVLIILGGFKWMTSGGNKDKVQEARDLLRNAAIGLVITVLSYAIARYVLSEFRKNTGVQIPVTT